MDFPWYSFWLRWEAKEVEEKENFQHPLDALMMSVGFKHTYGVPTDKCGLSNIYFETKHCST